MIVWRKFIYAIWLSKINFIILNLIILEKIFKRICLNKIKIMFKNSLNLFMTILWNILIIWMKSIIEMVLLMAYSWLRAALNNIYTIIKDQSFLVFYILAFEIKTIISLGFIILTSSLTFPSIKFHIYFWFVL